MERHSPKNVICVRPFMGLVGYYRMFIEGLSKISHPITSLQRKNVKFIWFKKCEESYQGLNNLLTSATILNIEYPTNDCVVCTDACIEGIGGVLM